MADERIDLLKERIRDIPDFPKEGIMFKDITPLLADPVALRVSIEVLRERFEGDEIDAVVGIESRGFMFGAALAERLGVGFVPVRKPGKLPAATHSVEYELEYGTDTVEIHQDALTAGKRAVIVDDLIATGGTAAATGELVRKCGAEVVAYAFVIDLTFLKGTEKLGDSRIETLIEY